jgi:hypothetical protein
METSLLLVDFFSDQTTDPSLSPTSMSDEDRYIQHRYMRLLEEVHRRLQLLRLGSSVRSVLIENDYVCIYGSDEACLRISDNR